MVSIIRLNLALAVTPLSIRRRLGMLSKSGSVGKNRLDFRRSICIHMDIYLNGACCAQGIVQETEGTWWLVEDVTTLVTMPYRVFDHGLPITKLHHIDYRNHIDSIHGLKGIFHGF